MFLNCLRCSLTFCNLYSRLIIIVLVNYICWKPKCLRKCLDLTAVRNNVRRYIKNFVIYTKRLLVKLYFQRSSAHTFDTLYCVKSAMLHFSAFPRTSSDVHFYNIEKISSHNVARITTIKMEIYKSHIYNHKFLNYNSL